MSAPAISIIEGDPIGPTDPEFVEMMQFESGLADQTAQAIASSHDEPWLNYLDATEPRTQSAIEHALVCCSSRRYRRTGGSRRRPRPSSTRCSSDAASHTARTTIGAALLSPPRYPGGL